MMSDWLQFSARALREGRTLKEASEAWHRAHRHLRRNPASPESEYHHARRKHLGGMLSRGVPFHHAWRMLQRNPKRLGGDWQPDLFGGAHKKREEGKDRADNLRKAREEMRDNGARDLFDYERDQKRRNPDLITLALVAGGAYAAYKLATGQWGSFR